MTTDEKFRECFDTLPEWVDAGFVGYPCGVRNCPWNFNGQATCDDYTEDHCFRNLYHRETDANRKIISEDEDGNEVIRDNECALGGELTLLEPWVREEDIPPWQRESSTLIRLSFKAS